MTDLAASLLSRKMPDAAQSLQTMAHIDDGLGPGGSQHDLDTLGAEDAVLDAHLDDRLLHSDLKSRIFGSSTKVLIGRYQVIRRIGRGGMGTVYVAHDGELDRKVAVKVLRPDRRGGRDRMLQEARALARLAHPNVVMVHEVGVHDERVFLAMELVQGKTLRAWLEQSPSRPAIFDVFAQAAKGLRAAHEAGLVHRDFKPENVLIGDDGRVRVVDFGVVKATDSVDVGDEDARALPSSEGVPDLTHTGQLLGTPAYMAAEQFLGQSVDARTDVFAFCVALYEALTGRRPYGGHDTGSIANAVLQGSFESLEGTQVPSELAALVQRGLSREPDERPGSMGELISALGRATGTATASPRRWSHLAAFGIALGLVGVVATAGLVTYSMASGGADSDSEIVGVALASTQDETEDEDPTAVDEAFAAMFAAPDDGSRLESARAFLDQHGEVADPSRRAIAHSIIGDVSWRSSCPERSAGLCIEARTLPDIDRCHEPVGEVFAPRPRDTERSRQALEHLDATLGLAGVDPSDDPAERELFGEAIGRARVQRLDAKLEQYLGIEAPTGLDFANNPKAEALSRQAFGQYHQRVTQLREELTSGYASVKKTKNPEWVVIAAARTGLIMSSSFEELERIPIPPTFSDKDRIAYCRALDERIRPAHDAARNAFAYCVQAAEKYGVTIPEVELCRQRLAQFDVDDPRSATESEHSAGGSHSESH